MSGPIIMYYLKAMDGLLTSIQRAALVRPAMHTTAKHIGLAREELLKARQAMPARRTRSELPRHTR